MYYSWADKYQFEFPCFRLCIFDNKHQLHVQLHQNFKFRMQRLHADMASYLLFHLWFGFLFFYNFLTLVLNFIFPLALNVNKKNPHQIVSALQIQIISYNIPHVMTLYSVLELAYCISRFQFLSLYLSIALSIVWVLNAFNKSKRDASVAPWTVHKCLTLMLQSC